MNQIKQLLAWTLNLVTNIFKREPVQLAIVRRYCDANGSYIGELYMMGTFSGVKAYRMIGASLDTLPLEFDNSNTVWGLDTRNDFLAAMPKGVVRVGAIDPKDNDNVRKMIARLPRHRMTLTIQNKFIEHVLETKSV